MEDKQRQHNPYDEMGLDLDPEEIKKQQERQKAMNEKLDILIHKTFYQTESGRELLDIWDDAMSMTPGVAPGMDKFEVGIIEGQKRFIRGIKITIRRMNKNE